MILLSDELWLIANDSKGFKNGSKSIIRNNLGLCKRSEIYLNYNFQKHCYGSTGKKIDLARKWISNKSMIFASDRKKRRIPLFGEKVMPKK